MIEKFFALFGTVGGYIIIGSVIVLVVAIIAFKISKARENKREQYRESLGDIKRTEQVIKGVSYRSRVNSGEVVDEPVPVKDTGIKVHENENAQQQQAQVLSIDIAKCYQKAEDIRILFKYFKEFRPEPTRAKPSSLKVLFAINWMGGIYDKPEQRYYQLLAKNYDGSLPQWHTVSIRKNDIPNIKEQQERFNEELKAFIATKRLQNRQINVS